MSRPNPKPTAKAERWEQVRGDRLASPAAGAGYQRARRALELGEQIRRLREARGISQAELGRRIGSTQPAIARLEAGRVSPTLETLDRVAAALGVELVIGFEDAQRHQHAQAPVVS
jgi:ribosome-binding protein aMBF1 (putative translation factor)